MANNYYSLRASCLPSVNLLLTGPATQGHTTISVSSAKSTTRLRLSTTLHSSSSSPSRVCPQRWALVAWLTIIIEWKRLLLADGPRQAINGLTLYSIYLSKKGEGPWDDFSKYSDNYVTTLLLCSTLFTVIIFVGSLLLLLVAAIAYIPLLCYIRGNLKEFCCHKVDKVSFARRAFVELF